MAKKPDIPIKRLVLDIEVANKMLRKLPKKPFELASLKMLKMSIMLNSEDWHCKMDDFDFGQLQLNNETALARGFYSIPNFFYDNEEKQHKWAGFLGLEALCSLFEAYIWSSEHHWNQDEIAKTKTSFVTGISGMFDHCSTNYNKFKASLTISLWVKQSKRGILLG